MLFRSPYWYCFIYSLSLKLKTEEINIDIISEYGFLVSSLPVITAPRDTGNKLFTRIVARNKQCIITPGDNILFLQCEAIPKDLSVCFGLKNNNKATYQKLGVTTFAQYAGAYIAKQVINIIAFILTFIVVTIILRAVVFALDIVTIFFFYAR